MISYVLIHKRILYAGGRTSFILNQQYTKDCTEKIRSPWKKMSQENKLILLILAATISAKHMQRICRFIISSMIHQTVRKSNEKQNGYRILKILQLHFFFEVLAIRHLPTKPRGKVVFFHTVTTYTLLNAVLPTLKYFCQYSKQSMSVFSDF